MEWDGYECEAVHACMHAYMHGEMPQRNVGEPGKRRYVRQGREFDESLGSRKEGKYLSHVVCPFVLCGGSVRRVPAK